jgi:D-aminopeptidase
MTVGALVLSNFGKPANLTILGQRMAAQVACDEPASVEPEKGSIIIILATDAPLDARQLRRLSVRACAGLARMGSNFGHGSGDIALAFSTAYTLSHDRTQPQPAICMLHEQELDTLFDAAAEATEQAILSSLWWAETVRGRDGHVRTSLLQAYPDKF